MSYNLTIKDLEYYIPRHDQILQEDMVLFVNEVYGNKEISGILRDFTEEGTELTLYLDERFDKQFTFIGGSLFDDRVIENTANFVLEFKNKFRPEMQPNEWMLKGSGKWIYLDKEITESKFEALTRWVLWAKSINLADLNFDFHSVTLLNKKYQYKSKNKRDKNIEKFEVLFDEIFDSLKVHKNARIRIVTDNMKGAQLAGFENSCEKYKEKLNISGVSIIEKQDFSSQESLLLQFVDMQIYAMSRYIVPSNGNILMDFEEFAMEHTNGTIHSTAKNKGDFYLHFMAAKYHILKSIFQKTRLTIRKNQFFEKSNIPESSCRLLSNIKHRNFGDTIDQSIHAFCTNPSNASMLDIHKL